MTGSNGWEGEKRPAFPFYAADWLISGRTRAIGPDGRGVYVDLLCVQWREGHIDDGDINFALGDPMAWPLPGRREEILEAMRAAFPQTEDGLRRNARLERERRILEDRRAEMSAGGRAGAIARWGSNGHPIGRPMASDGSSSSSSSSSIQKKRASASRPPSFDWKAVLSEFGELNTERVQGAVESYLAGRSERGQKRQTERGLRMALKGLRPLGALGALAVIEKATAGGWLGWPVESAVRAGPGPATTAPKRSQDRPIVVGSPEWNAKYPPREKGQNTAAH